LYSTAARAPTVTERTAPSPAWIAGWLWTVRAPATHAQQCYAMILPFWK